MTTEVGSTVPRRQLGRHLRLLRERAHVTVKDAAERLEISPQKVWRIETGRGQERIRSLDVEGMCRVYAAPPDLTGALVALAKETKAKGWWQSYLDAIPEWFELYVGLEASANHIRKYEQVLIPGLLQTRAYAEALFRMHQPAITAEDLDRSVTVRQERQALLVRALPAPPVLRVMLSEAVLRQPLGGAATMTTQLRALRAASEAPHISIRVLPFAAGPTRAAVAGAFTILEFPTNFAGDPTEPPTVYSEALTGALYLDRPEEIAAYETAWQDLEIAALGEGESREMMGSIIKELS
ncbi:helix-turn-helix transcriptional regulator [Solwaraspora sp. WMMD1047]|uniref:helix-turn-helix domain-containing protein n=1 Tax=Solwaraspora sp. WMMD1047 TaxID=3016102 RepID=UPI0024179322|nr:helix-turn-helix transcriptional regulator [Solwaraspora sp. WMMD1047]MDG4831783.1 helix-turn-helix transcriptional regulator [Solwaraspora sp. WMMD1047]